VVILTNVCFSAILLCSVCVINMHQRGSSQQFISL
jgi:hypothetical protein